MGHSYPTSLIGNIFLGNHLNGLSSQWHELQADVTSQTQAVQELYARTQNSQDKFDYLLKRISALPATLAADRSSQLI